MKFTNIISLAGLLLHLTLAEQLDTADVAASVNVACTGASGAPGVCIETGACTKGGGKFISNACPDTPNDIKCCTKASCGSGGRCQFADTCTNGNVLSNVCPGPANFKCCEPKSGGGGGDGHYPAPKYPASPPCHATTVGQTKKILAKFPGAVRQMYCMRDCSCNAKPSSDHCCGLAMDLMCSKAGGVRTETGRPIAEWIAQNQSSLKLKYVIWGQKIWQSSIDKNYKPWTQWKQMENRGSVTANHWDHIHVSLF